MLESGREESTSVSHTHSSGQYIPLLPLHIRFVCDDPHRTHKVVGLALPPAAAGRTVAAHADLDHAVAATRATRLVAGAGRGACRCRRCGLGRGEVVVRERARERRLHEGTAVIPHCRFHALYGFSS
jgi:hypothetical protein